MFRPILPLLVFIAASVPSAGQHWVGSAGINYGTYSMKSLKELQEATLESDIPLEIVESFPSRAGFEFSILRTLGNFSVGATASQASTGGRVSYADYSGSINHDIIVNNTIAAIQLENNLAKKEAWELLFSMRSGVAFNTMKYNTTLSIGNETDNLGEKFKSINFVISAGIGARFFYNKIFVHPEFRYETHLAKGDLHYSDDSDVALEVNNERVQVGWDGIRLSLSLGCRL